MKTLEILIPTYGRPESAVSAIESCLANPDSRLAVRCNSNGFEPSLEKFRNFDARLTYDCFATNCGLLANLRYLFQSTNARFCMLLSDEDRVDTDAMTEFLNFLDNCPESVSVISCSIFDLQNNRYYSRPNRLSRVDLDLNAVSALPIIPTYISGLVFSVAKLDKVDLGKLCKVSLGNAYSHLDISKHLLIDGYLRIYKPYFILKDKDINEGGEGFEHRKSINTSVVGNSDLNPLVYGPKARARQFYYSENNLTSLRCHIGLVPSLLSKLNAFSFFATGISRASTITIVDKSVSIGSEVKLALTEAKLSNEFSGSIFAYLFYPIAIMPVVMLEIFVKLLGKSLSLLNRVVVVVVVFRSRKI
jgi:hypothetical protein